MLLTSPSHVSGSDSCGPSSAANPAQRKRRKESMSLSEQKSRTDSMRGIRPIWENTRFAGGLRPASRCRLATASHRVHQDVRAGRAVGLLVEDDVHEVPAAFVHARRRIQNGRSRREKLTSVSGTAATDPQPTIRLVRLIRSRFQWQPITPDG